MALDANPSLARAAALVSANRGKSLQAGLPPNPSFGYEGQQLGSGGLAEQQGVLFSQELVRGGKLRLDRAVANHDVAIAQQELAAQRLRVLTDVRIAFYEALLAERQVDLVNSLLDVSNQGARVVDNLFRSKEVGRADLLQAQLEVERARILKDNSHHRQDAAWRRLATVVGYPVLPRQPLLGDAQAPPLQFHFDEVLGRIRSLSPELSSAFIAVDRARTAIERARAEPIPNLNVQGLVNVQDNGINGRPDGGLAVTMPIPLFNRNQGAVLRAGQEYVAARAAVSQIELDLQNRLAPTFEQYENARDQVVRYRDMILPIAQESLDMTRRTYEAGEVGYVAFLTAQRTFAYTHLAYLDALRALRISEAELEGLLLRESLQFRPDGFSAGEPNGRPSPAPIGGVELFR